MEDLQIPHGRVVDFKNTVIIMTSNIGARNIVSNKMIGFNGDESLGKNYESIKSNVMSELKKAFRPEFLNRVDEIIVFKQLSEEEIEKIVELMLKASVEQLREREIDVSFSKELKKHIAKVGFDPAYGARPLRRAIQNLIEDKLAEDILDGKVQEGDKIKLTYQNAKIEVTK